MTDLLFRDEVFQIVGAAIEVHKEMGNGFLEAVYQEALELELSGLRIPFQSQAELHIHYKEQSIEKEVLCRSGLI